MSIRFKLKIKEKVSPGRKHIDITGKTFGCLLVINMIEKHHKGYCAWKCQCKICGKFIILYYSDIVKKIRSSCSQCDDTFKLTPIKTLYALYERGAKKRDLEFKLSLDLFKNTIFQNCHYCGTAPRQKFHKKGMRNYILYNGIDRINNQIGYIKDNIVTCCKFCNLAKGKSTHEEFLAWIKRITIYNRHIV